MKIPAVSSSEAASQTDISAGGKVFATLVAVVFFTWLLTITIVISLSWVYSYAEIIAWKTEKTPFFLNALSDFNIPFRYSNYRLARLISIVLGILVIFISFVFLVKKKWIFNSLESLYTLLRQEGRKSLSAFAAQPAYARLLFGLLVSVSVVLRIFHFSYLPVHTDELMTYYFFVEKGFLLSTVFYPLPNNHFFLNYVIIFFRQFIDDPVLAGRISSAIFFHFLLLLLYVGILRYFRRPKIALLSLAMCALFFPASVYAAQARGYALLSLMLLVASFSLLYYLEKGRKEVLLFFVVASVIGACTVPVYLIPFMSLMNFWLIQAILQKSTASVKRMVLCGSAVALGVLVSYTPMFLFSGIDAVVANDTVAPSSSSRFYSYIFPVATAEILSFFSNTDTRGWLFFLVFGSTALIIYPKADHRYRCWMLLTFLMFIMIFIYAFLGRKFMFQRTVTYATYFLYPALAICLMYAINSLIRGKTIHRLLFTCLLLSVPVFGYYQYHDNTFEPSLLPSNFYKKVERFFKSAIADEKPVLLAVRQDYVHILLYARYLRENKGLLLVEKSDQAELVITDINVFDEHKILLQDFRLLNEVPSNIEFLPKVFLYQKNMVQSDP
jgi:hypothetical protein